MNQHKNPLRVGVIGADPRGFGARAHIPAVLRSPVLDLHAICTRHEEGARTAAEVHGARQWYGDIESMLSDDDIDLVSIAVRPTGHQALFDACLDAGKAVYCEWPLAANTVQATSMASNAKRSGVPVGVGLQGRFAPSYVALRDAIANGDIGTPLGFSASLIQAAFQVDSDRAWLTDSAEASGALHVATAHLTDIIEFILDDAISSVAAVTETVIRQGTFGDDDGQTFTWDTPDTVRYMARLDSGLTGSVNVTNAAVATTGFTLQVIGDGGQIDATSPAYIQFSPVTVRTTTSNGFTTVQRPTDIAHESDVATNVGRALTAFGRSIQDRRRFIPNAETGLRLHTILDAITDSHASGQWVGIMSGTSAAL